MAQSISDTEIRSLLPDNPRPLQLYDEVKAFYASRLRFVHEIRSEASAGWVSFNLDSGGPSAEIGIKTEHERAPISVAHELLHLELRIWQFPIRITDRELGFHEDLITIHDGISNVVDHHLFKERFLDLGYPLSEIVPPIRPRRDRFLASWVDTYGEMTDLDLSARRWAYQTYFIAWMCEALLGSNDQVSACLNVLSPNVPDLEERMDWLPAWFAQREFYNPCGFVRSISEAFSKMSIPRQTLYMVSKDERGLKATKIMA